MQADHMTDEIILKDNLPRPCPNCGFDGRLMIVAATMNFDIVVRCPNCDREEEVEFDGAQWCEGK